MKILAALTILLLLAGSMSVCAEQTNLNDEMAKLKSCIQQTCSLFKDMRATVDVPQSNRRELEKLGKSYAESYQLKTAEVCFKCPDKLRIEGQLGMMKATYITNGNVRLIRVPALHLTKREDVSKEPLRQLTSLDFGVMSGRVWDIFNVKLLRTEDTESGKSYVLQLTADGSSNTQIVWVSAADRRLLRRDRVLANGSIVMRIMYSGHKQYADLWIPTKAEVYNSDNKLAAVTETKDITVNSGVSDKEFE